MADKQAPKDVTPPVDVAALMGQLTKKNDEYVFKLRRILTDHQYSAEKQDALLATMLPEMIAAQREGKPATQLYGPVTVKADSLLNAPVAKPKAPYWLTAVDLSLFFTSMFGLVYGLLAYLKPEQMASGSGISSLIIMAIAAGFIFSYYNAWSRRDKATRTKTWIVMVAGMALILLASFVSGSLGLIASPLTSPTHWIVYAVLAAVTYGAHFLLKRRYNLPGIMAG